MHLEYRRAVTTLTRALTTVRGLGVVLAMAVLGALQREDDSDQSQCQSQREADAELQY